MGAIHPRDVIKGRFLSHGRQGLSIVRVTCGIFWLMSASLHDILPHRWNMLGIPSVPLSSADI
jgi:hypothetical protein